VLPTEQYDNRAAVSQIDREAQVNRSVTQAPDWMTKLPVSNKGKPSIMKQIESIVAVKEASEDASVVSACNALLQALLKVKA
jgi:hypothetical protein